MPVELSARAVAALPPRKVPYWVSPNLYCSKAKLPGFWLLMYASPVKGRRCEMGLGSIATVPLKQVRLEVLEYRLQIARGRCPLSERESEQEARKTGYRRERGPHTFEAVAEAYIAFHRSSWSNKTHAQQWSTTLATYAYPIIGAKPVARIDTDDILAIIEPIWISKTETASRTRGRIESVLDYARSRKWIVGGDNPARWRGHLENLLPKKSRVSPVQHHPAMGLAELPAFYQALSQDRGVGSLLLRYLIATALRTDEGRLAPIAEINREARLHIIPPPRTKTRTELRVPLSDEALRILDEAEACRTSVYLFGGRRSGQPLSDRAALKLLTTRALGLTVHGFRSSFRDWCAECSIPRELAEQCLGHTVQGVEGAYWRSDIIALRAGVMQRWAQFLTTPAGGAGAEIVDLKTEASRRAG